MSDEPKVDGDEYTAEFEAFLERIKAEYPGAEVYEANGPTWNDKVRTMLADSVSLPDCPPNPGYWSTLVTEPDGTTVYTMTNGERVWIEVDRTNRRAP